jgi:hypothetical protein
MVHLYVCILTQFYAILSLQNHQEFLYKIFCLINSLTNPRSIAKTDKLFKRDWDIVFLL